MVPGPVVPWLRRTPRTPCGAPPSPAVTAFHRNLPGYRPTPLVDVPGLAAGVGVRRLLVKQESDRFGLPAFKALGAWWAMHEAVTNQARGRSQVLDTPGPGTLDGLRALADRCGGLTFGTATDGNHGRAVARLARLTGQAARVYVPDGVSPAAVDAIRGEGAEIVAVRGDYDTAVAAAAADPSVLLIQDTAWPGYERVPGWIVDGYATLFHELDEQHDAPDAIVVPVGVGSLAQAAVTHYAGTRTAVVTVEADSAACALASLHAGEPVTVSTGHTAMAGLNCGTLSTLAWPCLAGGLSAATAVTEAHAERAVHDLAAAGVDAGPCGAASLAAARTLLADDGIRAHLGNPATVVLLSTEARP